MRLQHRDIKQVAVEDLDLVDVSLMKYLVIDKFNQFICLVSRHALVSCYSYYLHICPNRGLGELP